MSMNVIVNAIMQIAYGIGCVIRIGIVNDMVRQKCLCMLGKKIKSASLRKRGTSTATDAACAFSSALKISNVSAGNSFSMNAKIDFRNTFSDPPASSEPAKWSTNFQKSEDDSNPASSLASMIIGVRFQGAMSSVEMVGMPLASVAEGAHMNTMHVSTIAGTIAMIVGDRCIIMGA